MDDFEGMDDLVPADAAIIVAGMRLVAKADGSVHANELAMIEELGKGLPDADPKERLQSEKARSVYIASLSMLALADGVLSATEVTVIRELATCQGLSHEDTDAELTRAKHRFFAAFAGVRVFRDQAVEIGKGLGLSQGEIDDILVS